MSPLFRQLYDAESSTYTYLLGDPASGQAVLIDPVLEQVERDLQLVQELDLRLTHVFDTHVHADHVTASGVLRERTGATVVGGVGGAPCADLHVHNGDELRVGGLLFRVLATPGHTDDSVSYAIAGRVFTGDALLVRGTGRTDFQNGNAGQLWDSITQVLFALPDSTLIYPAHDYQGRTVTSVGEERRHNPRLAGKSREQFIELMQNLHLPKPKKLDLAVPANRNCGLLQSTLLPESPMPAPYRDLPLSALAGLGPGVRRIDVREPDEWAGPMGHLPGAELVPLATLEAASASWRREQPLLLICRSGNRSGKAAQLLSQRGFTRLYNLAGGMLAVNEAGLAVERDSG